MAETVVGNKEINCIISMTKLLGWLTVANSHEFLRETLLEFLSSGS